MEAFIHRIAGLSTLVATGMPSEYSGSTHWANARPSRTRSSVTSSHDKPYDGFTGTESLSKWTDRVRVILVSFAFETGVSIMILSWG